MFSYRDELPYRSSLAQVFQVSELVLSFIAAPMK
jgi:hypothetical protein